MADEKRPFIAPDQTCNARLKRRDGYCELPAGNRTDHPGVGRCWLHGGVGPEQDGADGPLDQFKALGFGRIIDLAQTMTADDQEYLMDVGTNALVVTRTGILARLQNPDNSAKESADLTMALQRIEAILDKYPDEDNPDKPSHRPTVVDDEWARLDAIAAANAST